MTCFSECVPVVKLSLLNSSASPSPARQIPGRNPGDFLVKSEIVFLVGKNEMLKHSVTSRTSLPWNAAYLPPGGTCSPPCQACHSLHSSAREQCWHVKGPMSPWVSDPTDSALTPLLPPPSITRCRSVCCLCLPCF